MFSSLCLDTFLFERKMSWGLLSEMKALGAMEIKTEQFKEKTQCTVYSACSYVTGLPDPRKRSGSFRTIKIKKKFTQLS
jgi:hypothetical protein